jgi:hypothetical protein
MVIFVLLLAFIAGLATGITWLWVVALGLMTLAAIVSLLD